MVRIKDKRGKPIMKALLYPNGLLYAIPDAIWRTKETPRYKPTKSGYGSKIPTQYVCEIYKRVFRIFAMCYSNVATHYIVQGGKRYYIKDCDFPEGPHWYARWR